MNRPYFKEFLILAMLVSFSFTSFAQDTIRGGVFPYYTTQIENTTVDTFRVEETPKTKSLLSKIYYGGYLNLSFGSYTVIGVEPLLAYKLNPKLSVGTKLSYKYIHYKAYSNIYEESNYGFSVFSRLRVSQKLYTHAEFSNMNYKFYDDFGKSKRKGVPFLFLGGGLSQPVSENIWLNAEVLFDVLQNKNSPYKDWEPFYSIGFGVGF